MNRTAFTTRAKGISRVISTPIEIFLHKGTTPNKILAIWDTGATGSVITKKVASELGLVQSGFTQVSTANGIAVQKTYTVDIKLPNNTMVSGVVVTEVDALSGGMDGLIGMDIISLGDLSITNFEGNTCMSFRVPSSHEIDFVKSIDFGVVKVKQEPFTATKKQGRNEKCDCGSGRKYKDCHGC